MWKNVFDKKNLRVTEEKKEEKKLEMSIEEANKLQNAGRTEPLQGTEEEIARQVEEGMKQMGFTQAEKTEVKPKEMKPRIRGNDYCPCGSNKKFKKCCSLDPQKVKNFKKTMDIKI